MGSKKQDKARAKLEKKRVKAELKAGSRSPVVRPVDSSPAVRYAELVRGLLYVVLGASLAVALALGQRGAILSLDDIIDGLFAAIAGKVVLAAIAIALTIYGLKHLRVLR